MKEGSFVDETCLQDTSSHDTLLSLPLAAKRSVSVMQGRIRLVVLFADGSDKYCFLILYLVVLFCYSLIHCAKGGIFR